MKHLAFALLSVLLCAAPILADGGDNKLADVRPPLIDGLPEVPIKQIRSSYRITVHETARNPFTGGEMHASARGTGTGVDERHILTAAHVVTTTGEPAELQSKVDSIDVDLFDDNGDFDHAIPANLVRFDPHEDLALIEVNVDLPFFHKLHYDKFVLGRWTYLIGASWGRTPYSVYWGMLAGKTVMVDAIDGKEPQVVLSQAAITAAPGCSGGGMYTPDGHFLGVLVRGADTNVALYVPAETVKRFMEAKPEEPKTESRATSPEGGSWPKPKTVKR